jgi:hypothetical protein
LFYISQLLFAPSAGSWESRKTKIGGSNMSRNERTADRRRRRPALGVAAGALFAGALITLAGAPTAGADPAAVGSAVTADQFSDMLTGEGTLADQMVDNFYQGISMAFQPEGPIDVFLDPLFGVSPF